MLMKVIKWIVILVAAFVGIGFLLPADYKVSRSIDINATPDKIYPHLVAPKAWPKWTVWNARDPNMKVTYSGADSGVGAKWAWESKSEGNGSMEFSKAEPNKMIEYKLFFPDFGSTSTGTLTLTPSGNTTKVTWTNEGSMGGNPLMRYFGLMMDSMVGKDFAGGLANLKALAEKS